MFRDFADSDEEYLAWRDTLTHTHQRRIRVKVMNLGHTTKAWIDDVLDGQVTIDVTNRECTRVCNLRLLDPSQSIGMEPDDASSAPVHLRRMVQVLYEVQVPGYGWVSCPVFTGPVVEMDRDGAEVSLVAEGKERLALGSFGHGHTWAKKRKKVEVIREILELAGEAPARIHLPPLKNTLSKPFNVGRAEKPWVQARKLARSLGEDGLELFYDGRGHVRARRISASPVRPFVDDDWLMTPVRQDRPKIEFFNGWIVNGANPPGDKPRVSSLLVGLPDRHPFSAQSLARNGKPYWKIREESRPQVKTKARATQIARKLRDEHIEANAQISFDMLPLPNVEEWDLLRAVDPLTGPAKVRVKQATIPLVGGAQTIGAIKRVSIGGGHRGVSFQPGPGVGGQ